MMEPDDIQYSVWTILSAIMRKDKNISLKDLDNMPAIAYNGGKKCDVLTGPCSCGGWHELDENRELTVLGKILLTKHKGV
jgi:hypothetical protein